MNNKKFKFDPKRYDFARDDLGKIRRAEKTKDNSVIRIKSFEGIYRWWRSRSLDTRYIFLTFYRFCIKITSFLFRFSLIPVGFALLSTFIIYNFSVFVYERQERVSFFFF